MSQLEYKISDFGQSSTWSCYKSSSGYAKTKPTTATKTVEIEVEGIPAGAVNIKGVLSVRVGSPQSGAAIRTVNGVSVATLETNEVEIEVSGNGTLSIPFRFRANGTVHEHVSSHTSSLTFSEMILVITYTAPQSKWESTVANASVSAGESVDITLYPSDESFSHAITLTFGEYSYSELLQPGVTEFSYSIPLEWLNAIPDSTSGVGSLEVKTVMDGEILASEVQNFTITCPGNIIPNPGSIALTPVNQMWGVTQQKISSAYAELSGYEGIYGSTIVSATIYSDGKSYNGFSATVDALQTSGEVTIGGSVTDSRGRTAYVSGTIFVTTYQEPKITNAYVGRCNEKNESSPTGTGGHALVNYTFTEIEGNSASLSIEYRPKGAYLWSQSRSDSPLPSEFIQFADVGTFSADEVYDVKITITDSVGSVASSTVSLYTAYSYMRWEPQNDAIGFGCYPSQSKCVEISTDWDLIVGGKTIRELVSEQVAEAFAGLPNST